MNKQRYWRNRKKDVSVEDQEDIDRGENKQGGGWCDGGSEMERER